MRLKDLKALEKRGVHPTNSGISQQQGMQFRSGRYIYVGDQSD